MFPALTRDTVVFVYFALLWSLEMLHMSTPESLYIRMEANVKLKIKKIGTKGNSFSRHGKGILVERYSGTQK